MEEDEEERKHRGDLISVGVCVSDDARGKLCLVLELFICRAQGASRTRTSSKRRFGLSKLNVELGSFQRPWWWFPRMFLLHFLIKNTSGPPWLLTSCSKISPLQNEPQISIGASCEGFDIDPAAESQNFQLGNAARVLPPASPWGDRVQGDSSSSHRGARQGFN